MQNLYTLSADRRTHACPGWCSMRHAGFENLIMQFIFIWLALIGAAGALAEPAGQNNDGALVTPAVMLRSQIVAEAPPSRATTQLDWQSIRAFYRARNYQPVWTDGDRLRSDTWYAIDQLARANEDGLLPGEYHLDEIRLNLDLTGQEAFRSVELLLTDGVLRYLRYLRGGRLEPQAADPNWHISRPAVNPVALLTAASESPSIRDALRQLTPSQVGYLRLKKLLRDYRALDSSGGWPVVPSGEALERGSNDRRVQLLRHRLILSGDLAVYTDGATFHFDADVEAAVRGFQARHGLEEDGIVGSKTLAALNVPVSARIQQILVNMERWRWMPKELGDRYLLVNMAGFELQAVDDGEVVMEMRVIIGRPYRSTPAFASEMKYLVFNPYWNVPHKLAILDLLPKQQANPDYLKEGGFRVYASWNSGAEELDPVDIDWSAFTPANFPYRLRQDPGESNSLGRIKFMLPNPYAVYLHDTPSRHLFRHPVRTFSSGCIRVEEPLQLANFVLGNGEYAVTVDVQKEIDSGKNHTRSLPRPLPVYLLYLTAWVDDQGRAQFRDDVYGRDVLVQRAWASGAG
jgi:murein L,D-transpeptidase YcbB/YkuD